MNMDHIHNEEKQLREVNDKPEKFKANKWIDHEEKIVDDLSSV